MVIRMFIAGCDKNLIVAEMLGLQQMAKLLLSEGQADSGGSLSKIMLDVVE
jgi:hypothetical protein